MMTCGIHFTFLYKASTVIQRRPMIKTSLYEGVQNFLRHYSKSVLHIVALYDIMKSVVIIDVI